MKDWKNVESVDGAVELLETLSKRAKIYIATGATDSNEKDIKTAFSRVRLSKYISGYYCFSNVGFKKGEKKHLETIISDLRVNPKDVTIVGDSYEKDIAPALAIGTNAIWLNHNGIDDINENVRVVSSLREIHI